MDLIGKGDHSKVYVVKDQRGRERAAKFVAEDDKPILEVETQVMDKREGKRYHGKAYWDFFGKHGNTYVLVMDLFGDTVWEYHDKYLGFELKTALMIGIQLTRRLQALHERGFIHRDISPDNFLVGKKGAGLGYIYLIDHSNAVKYKDELNRHKPKGRIPKLCEVDEFSSYHERLSRRTDLESLMYCLVFFLRSRLPWTRKTEYYGGVARVLCTPEHLCIGLPEELRLYCEHVRNLKFEDTPNYSKLIGYLRTALENAGEEEDNQFDWMES